MRPPVRAAVLLAILVVGPATAAPPEPRAAARPPEVVWCDFDLGGWQREGVVTLEGGGSTTGLLDALVDRNTGTSISTGETNPVTIAVEFTVPQVVRRVAVTPGGPEPYAVDLTVITSQGRRFAAGEQVVSDANAALFRLNDVTTLRLEVAVERLEAGQEVRLAELRVAGRLAIESITLEDVPERLPEGGSFPIQVIGRDSLGGRPNVTLFARLAVTPSRALAFTEKRRAVTRASGPLTIAPYLGELEGPLQPLFVESLAAAAPAPRLTVGARVIDVELDGQPPFEVFRRQPGLKTERSLGLTHAQRFIDDTVQPGSAYLYSVRRVDRYGNAATETSEETRGRALSRPPEGHLTLGRLPTLVVLYTDSLRPGQRDDIAASLELARLFVYRHTAGRIVIAPTYLDLRGPTPPTIGPTMAAIEKQLRGLGVVNDEFGLVFAVSDAIAGSWGNFTLLGSTAGAMGRASPGDGASVVTPPGALGPEPATAWSFVHELQHVLGGTIANSAGWTGLPSGHFAEDYRAGTLGAAQERPLDAGEAWDGQALLLGRLDFWEGVRPPYRRALETIDSDGDGLPDADPRLPLDEERFGTDPASGDIDGDGLDDLAEAMAGLYGPSNPRRSDTDGDGVTDGVDPWPLTDFAGVIPRGDAPRPLASGPQLGQPFIELAASWNDDGLRLEVTTPVPCDAYLDLDGSGRLGRWESDVNAGTPSAPASDVWAGPARISLRAHHGPLGVFVGDRRVEEAELAASRRDGRFVLSARLPRRLGPGAADVALPAAGPFADGLRLEAGRVLGLALTVRPSEPDQEAPFDPFPADGRWIGLFETHRLLDARLER